MKIVHLITNCWQKKSLISLSCSLSSSISLKYIQSVCSECNWKIRELSVCPLWLQNVKNILKLRKSLVEIIIDRKERFLREMICQFIDFAWFIDSRRGIDLIFKEKSLTSTHEQVIAQIQGLLSEGLANFVSLGVMIAPDKGLGLVAIGAYHLWLSRWYPNDASYPIVEPVVSVCVFLLHL